MLVIDRFDGFWQISGVFGRAAYGLAIFKPLKELLLDFEDRYPGLCPGDVAWLMA